MYGGASGSGSKPLGRFRRRPRHSMYLFYLHNTFGGGGLLMSRCRTKGFSAAQGHSTACTASSRSSYLHFLSTKSILGKPVSSSRWRVLVSYHSDPHHDPVQVHGNGQGGVCTYTYIGSHRRRSYCTKRISSKNWRNRQIFRPLVDHEKSIRLLQTNKDPSRT
jgi:hypothetical protein